MKLIVSKFHSYYIIHCSLTEFHVDAYPYTKQLLALEACRPLVRVELPPEMQHISTPLKINAWERGLRNHPDKQFTEYLIQGITQGFRIGFNYSQPLRSSKNNMISADQHPEIIDDYLANEFHLNRISLVPKDFQPSVHISPFGVIPKRNKPGKWRLILDLSSPDHYSVNEGISKELCSLSYTSIDEIVKRIIQLGQGAQLAKVDIK